VRLFIAHLQDLHCVIYYQLQGCFVVEITVCVSVPLQN